MSEELISVIDIAKQLGKSKQTIFKVLRRLGITPTKIRNSSNRGQLISYVTNDESHYIREDLQSVTRSVDDEETQKATNSDALQNELGLFYLLSLEPNHDPGRFKVGFTLSIPERLRALRCSAPFTEIVDTWPCKRLWEKTAIECVTTNSERLHTEIFRTQSIDSVIRKCNHFFDLMPKLPTMHDRL